MISIMLYRAGNTSPTNTNIKERGFVDIDEAENTWHFLADMVDELEIFYRLDWFAGEPMNFYGEYWFGPRETE